MTPPPPSNPEGVPVMRPIEAPERAKPIKAAFDPGGAPSLQWIKIEELVVDSRYQREITASGASNIQRIAEGFRWSKFAPVIVSPVEGGKFAIIDGQHRTTAARMRGVESVPCQVVIADLAEQAAAFGSINGHVTRMSKLQIFTAALAAGDKTALELRAIARDADVTLLRYPVSGPNLKAGETMALGSLEAALKNYGRATVFNALQCVTRTSNNRPGALSAAIISALTAILGTNHKWRQAGPRLLQAFERIDLIRECQVAEGQRAPGRSAATVLAERLREILAQRLEQAA